jgi:TolB-like protein/DNA-binding winged helix-turn-helix (wHTH) protein/Tfp pilus assembly protein PilF
MEKNSSDQAIIRFSTYELDVRSGELRKQGVRIKLQEQPFRILEMLLATPGQLVTREELRSRLWSSTSFVDFDHGLNKAMNKLREALGDSAESPRFIETLAKRGYRFICPVEAARLAARPNDTEATIVNEAQAVAPIPLANAAPWWNKRRRTVISGIIALLVALGLLAILWLARQPADGTRTARLPQEPSIAVLPFENRSDEHKDAFFVDGIHDDILTQLTKIGAIKVIARTSVEQFRNTRLTSKEIGEKLGVTSVLEGGVQRAGDHVHVTVQLIDAATDAHLWAESYDRELTATNIFAIQSEVAAAIAIALKTTLTPAERRSVNAIPTQSLDAWEAYQLGKQRQANRTIARLTEAEKFFQRAIDLDSKFALAYVGLADTLCLQVEYSGVPRVTGLARAEQAVGTALKLDPNLAEAWASSASIADARQQYDRAETMFRRAIALNPNYATAYHWFSIMLGDLGRADEARSIAGRAVELDPLSAVININFGAYLEAVGRFDEAETRYRRAIEIDPSMAASYMSLGELRAYAFNRFTGAVPLLQKAVELDPGYPYLQCSLGVLNLDLGDDAQATEMIQAAREHWPDDEYVLGWSIFVHLHQGDHEAALQDARRLLALNPSAWGASVALFVLRDADLNAGHPDVARARYAKAYPELFATKLPNIYGWKLYISIDLVLVLQKTGENGPASVLLDRIEEFIRTNPRMGIWGYGITDVQTYALRNRKPEAFAALRAAEKAGWRGNWRGDWRYYRDFDPNLASIRDEPEFKAVFADIARDMAAQRARLQARPKNAPLDLKTTSN